jgi:hypothetical protein
VSGGFHTRSEVEIVYTYAPRLVAVWSRSVLALYLRRQAHTRPLSQQFANSPKQANLVSVQDQSSALHAYTLSLMVRALRGYLMRLFLSSSDLATSWVSEPPLLW